MPRSMALNLRSTWVVAVIESPHVKKTIFFHVADLKIFSPFSVSSLESIFIVFPIFSSIFFMLVPISFAV